MLAVVLALEGLAVGWDNCPNPPPPHHRQNCGGGGRTFVHLGKLDIRKASNDTFWKQNTYANSKKPVMSNKMLRCRRPPREFPSCWIWI